MKKAEPIKVLGSSIIYQWYNEFEQLINYYAEYTGLLISAEKGSEDNGEQILHASNQMRVIVLKNNLRSKTILKTLGLKLNSKVKDSYIQIKEKDFIIKSKTIEEYILGIQEILLEESINKILSNTGDILEDVYGRNNDSKSTNNNN